MFVFFFTLLLSSSELVWVCCVGISMGLICGTSILRYRVISNSSKERFKWAIAISFGIFSEIKGSNLYLTSFFLSRVAGTIYQCLDVVWTRKIKSIVVDSAIYVCFNGFYCVYDSFFVHIFLLSLFNVKVWMCLFVSDVKIFKTFRGNIFFCLSLSWFWISSFDFLFALSLIVCESMGILTIVPFLT